MNNQEIHKELNKTLDKAEKALINWAHDKKTPAGDLLPEFNNDSEYLRLKFEFHKAFTALQNFNIENHTNE